MSAPALAPAHRETANDRFKRRSRAWIWEGINAAVVLHFAALAFWPGITIAYEPISDDDVTVLPLPDEIRLPEPPAPIQPPAQPLISETAPIDVTIALTTPEYHKQVVPALPPVDEDELSGYEPLGPSMIAPHLRNPEEVRRALERNYPALLRDAGIGGTVNVHIWLDESGRIVQSRIGRTSGQPALDEAALRVVDMMRFTPAVNRDRPVRVIVNLPIEFKAR